MTQYVKKLPTVFQTVTEKKFFDATFDQVLSKKDSDYLAGYLGRRNPGYYNPITDFYLPEPSKNRTWWQLEPTAFSRTEDSTKSNVFFYEDLLDNIEYYGGNTLNQDRLFDSRYYSFGPPIDYDMFVNYHDYYWIDQRLPVITITGVMAADIIGEPSFTTPPAATPPNFTLSTGMSIILADDPDYLEPHTVENFGGCEGIQLVPYFTDITAGSTFEFLPWDGVFNLSTGRIIDNTRWDALTWDTQYQPSSGDYITIQRGSLNRNAWSRTNKWYHIDTIKTVVDLTGFPFPESATRALRPIIQFNANLTLYNSGTQFNSEIEYGFRDYDIDELNPIRLIDLQGQNVSSINTSLGINLSNGDLVSFFKDDTEIDINEFPWDIFQWDSNEWDEVDFTTTVSRYIFEVNIDDDGIASFSPYTSWQTPVNEGDIVIVKEDGPGSSAQAGSTWYYENGAWYKAFNDKISLNQPPLFQLYDHNGIRLDDEVTYPESTFQGNKIFSYKINSTPGATVDPVLRFPIVYTGFGQASDIVFQNNLIVDRYTYVNLRLDIDGYYYYKETDSVILRNSWNLYEPCECEDIIPPPPVNCINKSKQRVIDKYTVGYGTEYQFKLSVTPLGYPASPDIIVSVNGVEVKNSVQQTNGYTFIEINNNIYVDLTDYLSTLLTSLQKVDPVVEIQTYSYNLLDPAATGYFAIPQELEANPNQEEVTELSGSDLTEHFVSIIGNQINFSGTSFGGPNNYRDTRKNQSLGQKILQNTAPLLKTMLVSPKGDLSFIEGVRFSSDEYSKFKNKYLKIAQQLIDTGFNPVQYQNKTVIVSAWVEEILKQINISKEFSKAFAYSYMIANGSPFATESVSGPITGTISLSSYVDLSDPKNALYIYEIDNTGQETLLVIGKDYNVVSTNLVIEIEFINPIPIGSTIYAALYKNALPAYIPSTPSKLGTYPTYVPRMEWDATYVNPTWVIIGHDGSKTIAYGSPTNIDYRDQLLLELEKRIYNLIQSKFRTEYYLPLRLESVKPGFFRESRYSRQEYLDITVSYINKWSAKNRANYRANDWDSLSTTTPVDKLWKLYNYSDAVNSLDEPLNLPGNWKGIFQYMYDTYNPDTRPWEMLGFSEEPSWWRFEYGNPVINLEGQEVWPSTAAGAHNLYYDLEMGIIRQGPSAEYDPVSLQPMPQSMWARPGLSSYIPVDSSGEIRPVIDVFSPANSLFDITYSGNPYEPFDGYDHEWAYGDGGPVEQAWMSTSAYTFSVQEFLFLMKPAMYGEFMWDTSGTELSPGYITVPDSLTPVRSSINWQYVQNNQVSSDDSFFSWMRPRNKTQIVHAESIDGDIQIRYGYQRWISDKILFLGKDITSTFGVKIRNLDVNLANKLAGFTNKDTTNTYIESVTPGSITNSLIIPSNNFDVLLHKSPVVDTYTYSGVVIRALADGTFVVYGYDLLKSSFTVLDRSTSKLIEVEVGGTPAEFLQYTSGTTYKAGDIVRYNGVYYLSKATQTVQKFADGSWDRLKTLPVVGGISVSYKPVSEKSTTIVPYGSVMKSVQEVFDFLIGWGAYLESRGWKFDEVNQDTNQISDWLYAGKQFLFWLNSNWAPDASIQLSPLANKATLVVNRGYPDDVETMSNGVYSILDKFGVSIDSINTVTDREGQLISVSPATLASGGIYFLQVNVSETEHVLIFDNRTSFNDLVYSPLLRTRQQRLRFNGFRSNGWYGKMEAPGYLVIGNQLVPNYDSIVDAMRYYYDPNTSIDNPSIEDLGRHLIGYESKSYLDNLQVSNDVQYLFYKGAIRQKGTIQAFDKLFRSTKIQTEESLEVFEEWAFKVGEFGNTVEQVSTEFILKPEQNSGDVIVARLNYVPSETGFVRKINLLNARNVYKTIPTIVIAAPDAGTVDDRQAKAYAVLGADGLISRIDISDVGYGYTYPPEVNIISSEYPINTDRAYSVWQGKVVNDTNNDNIIDIDIDETDIWTVRPVDPSYSLNFPTTDVVEYYTPNAGYVNFDDVDLYSFDKVSVATSWGTTGFNPVNGNTIWVANTFTEDWNVFKLVDSTTEIGGFDVIADEANNLYLRTDPSILITSQFVGGTYETDFGNLIALQVQNATASIITVGGVITEVSINKLGAGYISTFDYTVSDYGDGNAIIRVYIAGGSVSDLEIINGGTGYIDEIINLPEPTVIEPNTNYAVSFEFDPTNPDAASYNYYRLLTLDGSPITSEEIPVYADFTNILLFKKMRFWTEAEVASGSLYISIGDKVWVDGVDLTPQKWTVFSISNDTPAIELDVYRQQEQLIDTRLFENTEVFSNSNSDQLVRLPVYDPFKGILPALAKQNITYITLRDPARYNVTTDPRLFSENINFAERQVGELWWDISTAKYVYYEQPRWLNTDGTYGEDATDNLVYRRDNWGRLFPGSTVSIYEWTRSSVPPDQYTGSGIPRDINSYVQVTNINKFTNIEETTYYFWVLNPTGVPNRVNRTIAAESVASLLQSPRSQGFTFFAPIQETDINTSYMFYNIQSILSYRGNNVQVNYRQSERNDQPHTQWAFYREGDVLSTITDQFWNKMVDSICGYTKVLPISDEYSNSILIDGGEVLPVPDPTLSEIEKYGIMYRPRQGMFRNLTAARKVFVQSANNLLKYIPVRDDNPSWNNSVSTDDYWAYTTWYKPGYEDVEPTVSYQTLSAATVALSANQLQLGDIVLVIDGTVDGRFVLYAVTQLNPNIPALSLEEVAVENSAIKLLDTAYTTENSYGLSVELRELLNAFRTEVMVDENLVDQNKLFFSMVNYVLSEQKNVDWLFKSSYIYVKENNVPLVQDQLYLPNQIESVVQYINDAKPYHTQIRDYSSRYLLSDIADGTAIDIFKLKSILTFGPRLAGWDMLAWDNNDDWDVPDIEWMGANEGLLNAEDFVTALEQYVSGDDNFNLDTITVEINTPDIGKKGYSNLYPYTFDFTSVNLNDPQTFITPEQIVAVRADNRFLLSGHDYYVEYNDTSNDYTVYFYNDPSGYTTLEAFVWFDGGQFKNIEFNTYRNELALGFGSTDLVVNVDTKLPLNDVSAEILGTIPATFTAPYAPLVGWGTSWDGFSDPAVSEIIVAEGGTTDVPWDAPVNPVITEYTISSKENRSEIEGVSYIRNNENDSGTLVQDLLAPTKETENIDVVIVSAPIDVYPTPTTFPGVIWIDGERIEYKSKRLVLPGVWELGTLRRGTEGTAPTFHSALVPTVLDPLVTVPNKVWVEKSNLMPVTSNDTVWQATSSLPDISTEQSFNAWSNSQIYYIGDWVEYAGIIYYALNFIDPNDDDYSVNPPAPPPVDYRNWGVIGSDPIYTSVTSVPLGGLWYSTTAPAMFLKDGRGKSIY